MPTHRISRLLNQVPQGILSVYFTAGYPNLEDTLPIACSLAAAGVDLIEIGIPYSDPVADGPTIQGSNHIALQNGMNLKLLLDQLESLRLKTDIPVILMGYLNPILQYGVEQFCKECQIRGVDGLIIPDLPMQEYLDHYQQVFQRYHLHNIFLVTPQTTPERIQWIDRHSQSFIYAVSDASITGSTRDLSSAQKTYFEKLRNLELNHPFLIGFGIHDYQTFSEACQFAQGAIIGSAFIKILSKGHKLTETVNNFVKSIKSSQT
ncbi:MAG: tryptophan synthase subunit alpha [Cyclobacteriaceae bacterium]|nr:tryptophan synthase subunit alpha [Cyclobacteriaceae bacterium]